MTPDQITSAAFATKRRGGLDPDAVATHLAAVAATVEALNNECDVLSADLASLRADAEATAATEIDISELSDVELTERVGQDAARLLAEARSAAADRLGEAEEEARTIIAAAEELHAERSMEADAEAQRIRDAAALVMEEHRADAERAALDIIANAEAGAQQAVSEGTNERDYADAEAERLIREAELTRRQILEDLARRRSAARRQIEQLRAGRERLMASHDTVRRALDEISEELTISMSEARAAAETAGHTVSDTTIEELEAEIETARLTGLLDTGPVPVVTNTPKRTTPKATSPTTKTDQPTERLPVHPDSSPAPISSATPEDTDGTEDTEDTVATADSDESSPEVSAEVELESDANGADANASEVTGNDAASQEQENADAEQASDSDADLAPVVQLDRARGDVDTATHPAKGRDASNGRNAKTQANDGSATVGRSASSGSSKVTKLESVKSKPSTAKEAPAEAEPEVDDDPDSVGDLFASLRSETPAPKKVAKKAKKSTAKKPAAKKATAAKSSAKAEPVVEVDSSEMARRFKRVLADEQSRAMSSVKAAKSAVELDDLVGTDEAHSGTYWSEVLGQMESPADAPDAARAPIDELVATIRRRVGESVNDADGDNEALVEALRSVYREVKTRHISTAADAVCRTAGVGVQA